MNQRQQPCKYGRQTALHRIPSTSFTFSSSLGDNAEILGAIAFETIHSSSVSSKLASPPGVCFKQALICVVLCAVKLIIVVCKSIDILCQPPPNKKCFDFPNLASTPVASQKIVFESLMPYTITTHHVSPFTQGTCTPH
jgi:hypothetical protein